MKKLMREKTEKRKIIMWYGNSDKHESKTNQIKIRNIVKNKMKLRSRSIGNESKPRNGRCTPYWHRRSDMRRSVGQ